MAFTYRHTHTHPERLIWNKRHNRDVHHMAVTGTTLREGSGVGSTCPPSLLSTVLFKRKYKKAAYYIHKSVSHAVDLLKMEYNVCAVA